MPSDAGYLSLQLTDDELEEITDELLAADLENLGAGDLEGKLGFDCATAIIRTDVSGNTIEIAAAGLISEGVPPEYIAALPYPPGVIAVDRLLNRLARRVLGDPVPYDEPLPLIPVAPSQSG